MEKKLKKLFDYQRFEKNEKLENLIRETESRYATELSDDNLSLVNAAGESSIPTKKATPLEAEHESEYQKYLKWLQEQKK